ncbi:hypothetical protein [Rhizobium sp. BK176]|uniref:hypothetical protein n=1 Tax=Rhizobium sp. BK176 TaxID=2587071 RepID=UPI00216804D0|nr:hypothetical protein [Rhizobium sp. BK176]MCS4089677.1 hypothetical protein [Rhizobium sp. BK176]
MKIDASYPLLFKARPTRTTRDKDVFVSAKGSFDIPELTLSEMPVVFESRQAYAVERGFVRQKKIVNRRHEVRMLDGALYRPVCERFDTAAAKMLFERAFPMHATNTAAPGYDADISLSSDATEHWRAAVSPLSRPLYEQLMWRLSCDQIDKRRLNDFWPTIDYARNNIPNLPQGLTNGTQARNMIGMDDVRRDLQQIDEAQLAYCPTAARKHMERFVIADGGLWQRSRGPVYRVQIDRATYAVTVSMTHAPDWHDTRMNVRYFDLNDRDAAFECAEQLIQELRSTYSSDGRYQKPVSDFTVPYDMDDMVPKFESGEDELFRLSCAVAAENRRFLVRNPKHADRLAPERLSAVWRAFEEVRKTDYVFDQFGDPTDDLRTNIDIWLLLGRRQSTYSFEEECFSTLAFRRVAALEDARRISLSPTFSSRPGL